MQKLVILFVAFATLAISCQRDLSNEINREFENNDINDFFVRNRAVSKMLNVNSTTENLITGSQGAKILLPANGFVTDEGKPVTGSVSVSIKEIYTPMDMIFNNMPTTSGNRLLETGGEFQVKVSQNNKELKLAPGNFIRITIPDIGRNLDGMQVFKGIPDASGNVDWTLSSNPGNVVVRDSLLFANSNLFSDNIEWINCDKFINEPTVDYTVYPVNAPSGDSTNVFVYLTGKNTLVKMNWTQGLNYFNSNMLLPVPSSIVGISIKNGQLFASVTSTTIVAGGSITMNFSPYSEEQLKNKLSQLK